ncbi:MAG: hypothetical protein IJR82_02305 [Bacilli bacterium]|nr:hypothetical protein [Bacilli bacterium]
MKIFEKVKNMFTEEVDEEVEVEQVSTKTKKESTPTVVDSFEEVKIEKEEVKKPVFFTDHDFEDMEQKQNSRYDKELLKNNHSMSSDYDSKNEYNSRSEFSSRSEYGSRSSYQDSYTDSKKDNKIEAYRGNQTNVYDDPYKEKKEERVFKPTPIISPVYGILDKNYHKEDIVSKKENTYSPVGEVNSIDAVRQKAYGTLEDELENTLFGSNSILFNKKDEENKKDDFFEELEQESRNDLTDDLENEENLTDQEKKIRDLEEITMDIGKELNTLLNKKESGKNKEEVKNNDEDEDDLFNLIDTMYEGDE